jgi:post-segregation antitoxin (ccd killing protein)
MSVTQKITVEVPVELLERARAATGAGVTETVREGLQELVSRRAQLSLLALGGKVPVEIDLDVLREDR